MEQTIVDQSRASELGTGDMAFHAKIVENQHDLAKHLRNTYDFIVCGSGSSGSVVARRLAENSDVTVLLVEAGGSDEDPSVALPGRWPANLGSERDWAFRTKPNARLNGRAIPLNMGKVLGGGSSINVMIWSRGHKNDWNVFANAAGDDAWNYQAVLGIYRRIEDWAGSADHTHRGTGGPVFVQPAPDPNPIAPALLDAAKQAGVRRFDNPNGELLEGDGGCSLIDMRVRNGRRLSVFRSYVYPYMDRKNLTVLTGALVTQVRFDGHRATGVEVAYQGKLHRFGAGLEIVLSMGAIQTPKVLMQSGVGPSESLRRVGITTVRNLPGVGQNFQDHAGPASCMWEYEEPQEPRNNGAEATLFWKSDNALDTPDIQVIQGEVPFASPEVSARYDPPPGCWVLWPGLVRPESRGHLSLTGPHLLDPVDIHANTLDDPKDVSAILRSLELCRDLGNSQCLRPFVKREVMPGVSTKAEFERFVKDAVISVWHPCGTAKMGRDEMAVVDGKLRVYGFDNLRIADSSVMPRVTTGNTMAPCVIIGERASDVIRSQHRL